ncbi:hypothetical protein M9458_004393, partial [Cirrhinus mrigala]
MSCTILYPLLLLLLSTACMSEVPQQENEVQAEGTEDRNVEERGALLVSGQFQPQFATGINSELAEMRSTVNSLKNRLQVAEEQLEQLRRN